MVWKQAGGPIRLPGKDGAEFERFIATLVPTTMSACLRFTRRVRLSYFAELTAYLYVCCLARCGKPLWITAVRVFRSSVGPET